MIQAVAGALVKRETLRPPEVREVIAAIPLEVFKSHQKRLGTVWEKNKNGSKRLRKNV